MIASGELLLGRFWHLQSLHALGHQAYSLWQNALDRSCSEFSRPILDWLNPGRWRRLLQLHSIAEALLDKLLLELQSFEHHSVATAEWGWVQVGCWRGGGFGRLLLVLVRFLFHLVDQIGRRRLEL